eukprot:1179011-Pleurochrysis_carterae.AAC.1
MRGRGGEKVGVREGRSENEISRASGAGRWRLFQQERQRRGFRVSALGHPLAGRSLPKWNQAISSTTMSLHELRARVDGSQSAAIGKETEAATLERKQVHKRSNEIERDRTSRLSITDAPLVKDLQLHTRLAISTMHNCARFRFGFGHNASSLRWARQARICSLVRSGTFYPPAFQLQSQDAPHSLRKFRLSGKSAASRVVMSATLPPSRGSALPPVAALTAAFPIGRLGSSARRGI